MDWEFVGLFVLFGKVLGEALFKLAAWGVGLFTFGFSLAAIAAAYKFFRLRREPAEPSPLPPVTILKPLKGLDRDLYECLRSFCRLDYPSYQLLFTVAGADDPALAEVARLRREFPALDMETVVSKSRVGFNPKVNNLSNAAPFMKHGLILMSDSDVKVAPDFLRRTVAALEPGVGLVTCFYRASAPRGVWSRLEALSVNARFLPQAVTAAAFGLRFAMGAAMLVRRDVFEDVGGFGLMADHLADDFVLGEAVTRSGYRIEIASPVVESTPDVVDAREHLRHQARWARTIRLCNPSGYAGTFVLHGFSLLTLKLLLFGFDARTAGLLAALWAASAASQAAVGGLAGVSRPAASAWLLPLSEWISFAAWLSGFGSGQVLWRGEVYSVEARGRLRPLGRKTEPVPIEP